MPSPTEITVAQLSRLVGLPNAPTLVDVRSDKEFQTDPRLVPTSRRHDSSDPAVWWKRYAGQSVIVLCQQGRTSSQTVAAWLRHHGLDAQTLEGGYDAWRADRHRLLRTERLPRIDSEGRTVG